MYIQNCEAKIGLSLEEQPDLSNISAYYRDKGGEFWVALEEDKVIGTIALMNYGNGNAVLKKFFVEKSYRSKGIGYALYMELLHFAKAKKIHTVILDTPSAAKNSHRFYERSGFKKIEKSMLPFPYEYVDRDCYLYLLEI